MLRLIARGATNREAELGVKDRAAAVAVGFERGLLTPRR